MADEVQAPEPLSPEEATKDSEAVKTDDDRYVGVDPIYKNDAYLEPLEVGKAPRGADDETKDRVAAEADVLARVKANEAGNVVGVDEVVPFEEWLPNSSVAVRHQAVRGLNEDQVEADRQATEDAKGDDGRIAPRSGSTNQPGQPNNV